jgi:5'-nucleotidase
MAIILLTNDDGVSAPGLAALAKSLSAIADCYTVAPDRERSASGHSLTIHKPLKVTELASNKYSLNGTPTDCVAIGVNKIMPRRPDLIVSGINNGPNLGDDITYSGTVSAAMEGTIMNIPSIAVSINALNGAEPLFDSAAEVAGEVARMVLHEHLPYDTLLNVNVPNLPYARIKGTRLTRQGKRVYDNAIQDSYSPWREKYYWIGGGTPYWEHDEDTDICAVMDGFVSITPLHLDLTNYSAMELIREQWTKRNSDKPGN